MPDYRFNAIVAASPMRHEEILTVTDAIGDAGCTDASIRGHAEGMELLFERTSGSLEAAMTSAIANIESAGFRVVRVEMEREAIPV